MTETDDTDGDISRRQVLTATGALSATLVAGCSQGNGGDEGDEDEEDEAEDEDSEDTATATQTVGGASSMDVAGEMSSHVDTLSVAEHRPNLGYFGEQEQTYFPVEVTVANEGDQSTDVMEYYYDVVAYDADGNDVSGGQGGKSSGEGSDADPGGQATIIAYTTINVDPSEVARYEVTIRCESSVTGFTADGVYCQ